LRNVRWNRSGEYYAYAANGKDNASCGAGGVGGLDGAGGGRAVRGGLALGRWRFRAGVSPILRYGDGDYADREAAGRVVVQGGRRRGVGRRTRPGVVGDGPDCGLGTSGAPVVSKRAPSGVHWRLSGAAEGARIGCHVVHDGGGVGADLGDAAFWCAVR